jgi:4-carboxymuconolactone decarboxylase
LERLDAPTRSLVVLSAAIATGIEPRVEAACRDCVDSGVSAVWVDELLLQSVLMVGWPRALTAAAVWRTIGSPGAAPGEDGTEYLLAGSWEARGEAVCRTVYGANYERLRSNVRALHPALDAWMVTEGYGRTLGRPGLDLARRELCVVVQVAVQGAERQLHSHLKGALHAGTTPEVITEALGAVRPLLGPHLAERAMSLWDRIRK